MKTCANCANCAKLFNPDARAATHARAHDVERIKYCSPACARQAENRRHYRAHAEAIARRVRRNQKRAKRQAR